MLRAVEAAPWDDLGEVLAGLGAILGWSCGGLGRLGGSCAGLVVVLRWSWAVFGASLGYLGSFLQAS